MFFKVYNSTFSPFDSNSVYLFALAGCEQHPCGPGVACSYRDYSLLCTPCPGVLVSSDGLACYPCEAGSGPNTERSDCIPCSDATYSISGSCDACEPPRVVKANRTACDSPFVCPVGWACPTSTECTDRVHCVACLPGNFSLGTLACAPCNDLGKVN